MRILNRTQTLLWGFTLCWCSEHFWHLLVTLKATERYKIAVENANSWSYWREVLFVNMKSLLWIVCILKVFLPCGKSLACQLSVSGERASVALILRVVKVIQLSFSLINWLLRFHFLERKNYLSLKSWWNVFWFVFFVCFFFIVADIGKSLWENFNNKNCFWYPIKCII